MTPDKYYDKVVILTREDKYMTLQEWQNKYGLPSGSAQISKHFSYTEPKFMQDLNDYGKLVVCEPLMVVLDRYRELIDEPVHINSFNRDSAKQQQLIKDGFKAAKYSPHEVKMAADCDTLNEEGTYIRVAKMRQAGRDTLIPIRIGFKQYLAEVPQKTFIHVDVCPVYFAVGKPRHNEDHPVQWENRIEW